MAVEENAVAREIKYKDKLGRTITVTHDSYNVRIKIEDKKIEEIITKNTFYQRMERGKWEPISNLVNKFSEKNTK